MTHSTISLAALAFLVGCAQTKVQTTTIVQTTVPTPAARTAPAPVPLKLGSVTGRVVDAAGKPLAGAQVVAYFKAPIAYAPDMAPKSWQGSGNDVVRFNTLVYGKTDPDGLFTLTDLPAGSMEITAKTDAANGGWWVDTALADVRENETTQVKQDLRLDCHIVSEEVREGTLQLKPLGESLRLRIARTELPLEHAPGIEPIPRTDSFPGGSYIYPEHRYEYHVILERRNAVWAPVLTWKQPVVDNGKYGIYSGTGSNYLFKVVDAVFEQDTLILVCIQMSSVHGLLLKPEANGAVNSSTTSGLQTPIAGLDGHQVTSGSIQGTLAGKDLRLGFELRHMATDSANLVYKWVETSPGQFAWLATK